MEHADGVERRIDLSDGGECETLSGVFSTGDNGGDDWRRYPCRWRLADGLLTLTYETGEVERFEYSDSLSFASIGHQGGAPGFRPVIGEQYPVTDG